MRKRVKKILENVPEGTKIKLDSESLDELIFDTPTLTNGKVIKIPIFTGPILRKIDLSELSFNGVNLSRPAPYFILNGTYDDSFYERGIDFSYTNIKIDFSCVSESVTNCNFEGIDLSNSNVECVKSFVDTNLKNTKFPLKNNCQSTFTRVDFSGNDFSEVEFNLETILSNAEKTQGKNEYYKFGDCNFYNTNINFVYDPNVDLGIFVSPWHDYETRFNNSENYSKQRLCNYIKNGNIQGCRINEKRIPTIKEIRENIVKSLEVNTGKIDGIINQLHLDVVNENAENNKFGESSFSERKRGKNGRFMKSEENQRKEKVDELISEELYQNICFVINELNINSPEVIFAAKERLQQNKKIFEKGQTIDNKLDDTKTISSEQEESTFDNELDELINAIANDLDIEPQKLENGKVLIKKFLKKINSK